MTNITQANGKEISGVSQEIQKNYEAFKGKGLKLDLTRGKPSAAQLDLSAELLALPGSGDFVAEGGVDCRNYGGLQGLTEARRLFSGIMGAPPEQVVVANNSSLALMHDTIVYALLAGTCDGAETLVYAGGYAGLFAGVWAGGCAGIARRRDCVSVPGAWIRPALHDLQGIRNPDDSGGHEGRRPGHG